MTVIVFDRIAVVVVAAWFVAGSWLVVQSLRSPRWLPPAGEAAGE